MENYSYEKYKDIGCHTCKTPTGSLACSKCKEYKNGIVISRNWNPEYFRVGKGLINK